MRSVDTGAALALLALLVGCASAPPAAVVTAPPGPAAPAATAPSPTAAVTATPVPVEAPLQREFDAAKAALRAGRTADAERAFRQLAAQHPELVGAHANLGVMLREAGRHDESVAALERAVQASPAQPAFWAQLGLSYRHQGRFAKARDAYERALALDPDRADVHLNLGVLLDLYLGDNAAALAHYERYQALAPGGDVAVGKWIADLKARKPVANVAQADVARGAARKDP